MTRTGNGARMVESPEHGERGRIWDIRLARRDMLALSLAFFMGGITAACARGESSASVADSRLWRAELPEFLEYASEEAREAYRFALQRPDVLRYLPCYCGCTDLGHTSNLSCYIKGKNASGQSVDLAGGGVVFDNHAVG